MAEMISYDDALDIEVRKFVEENFQHPEPLDYELIKNAMLRGGIFAITASNSKNIFIK